MWECFDVSIWLKLENKLMRVKLAQGQHWESESNKNRIEGEAVLTCLVECILKAPTKQMPLSPL